jgi:hypothetical protein
MRILMTVERLVRVFKEADQRLYAHTRPFIAWSATVCGYLPG